MRSIWTRIMKHKWVLVNALLTVVLLVTLGVRWQDSQSIRDGQVKTVITLGPESVYAAGSVDYTYGAANANVQFQAALNALPATGGRLVAVSSGNVTFAALATVTRAIDNVVIEGAGNGTLFAGDGVTPIFTAGGNNWRFINFRTNASSLSMGATTGWSWLNVNDGTTAYDYRNPTNSIVAGVLSATEYNATGFVKAANVSDSSLTDGRVVTAGIAGLLQDNSNLTFNNGALQVGAANVTRSATIVIASVNATVGEKAQADYTGDGVNDDEIQTAIDTINAAYLATGKRGTIQLLGPSFVTTSSVLWKSGVNLIGNGANITASTTDYYGSFNFGSVYNAWVSKVNFKSQAGSAPTYKYPLAVYGTTDYTVVFEDVDVVSGDNTTTADVTAVFETAHPVFIRGTDYGHNGNQNATFEVIDDAYPVVFERRGIAGVGGAAYTKPAFMALENSHSTFINCIGTGGPESINGPGLKLWNTSTTARTKVIGGHYTAGGGGGAITADLNDNSEVMGAIADAGTSATSYAFLARGAATGDYVGITYIPSTSTTSNKKTIVLEGASSPRIQGGSGSQPSFGDTNRGIYVRQNASGTIDGLAITPERFSFTWEFDDANDGRFTPPAPVAGQAYYVVGIRVDVVNANAGVTMDIGTSANGTQVGTGFNLAVAGGAYAVFTPRALAANAYLYAHPSAPITDGDVKVDYIVVTNNVNGVSLYLENTTAGSRLVVRNSIFVSNAASDAFQAAQVTAATWMIENSTLETMNPSGRYAVNLSGALANVPIRNSILRGELANVTNLLGEGSGVGTGAQQTIAHGLGFTPTRAQIIVSSANATPTAYQNAIPTATNIYVTAAAGEAYDWRLVGR